jgi:two-component system CheB/CheR fusion protein
MSDRIVGASEGARIVLVEDHPDAAESLALLLELLGHRVRVFSEGAAALAAASTDPPDLMVVDIGLPGIDGYEIARRVRRDPLLRHAVLIALTGYGSDDDRRESKAAGFDHHLVKPVEPRALEDLVARLGKPAARALQ